MLASDLDGSRSVADLCDDLDVILETEHHREPTAHQSLIIDDGDPDAHCSPIGNRARTQNPPPGRGPASKVPPSKIARSLIPTIPWPDPGKGLVAAPVSVTSMSR